MNLYLFISKLYVRQLRLRTGNIFLYYYNLYNYITFNITTSILHITFLILYNSEKRKRRQTTCGEGKDSEVPIDNKDRRKFVK